MSAAAEHQGLRYEYVAEAASKENEPRNQWVRGMDLTVSFRKDTSESQEESPSSPAPPAGSKTHKNR